MLAHSASICKTACPAGEDFSFFGHSGIPSAFTFLGIRNEKAGSVHALHTGKFTMDEDVLSVGAGYHTALAMEFLSRGSLSSHDEL